MDTQWYGSIAGIVAGTLIIVEILKRLIGNVAVLKAVPTWVYSVAVAGGLTAASRAAGYLVDQGSTLDTLSAAVMMAASASGFWTWLKQPKDPIEDSQQIGPAKGTVVPAVLLAVALSGAVGCAGKNIAPELVATQHAVHDALASAQDRIEDFCTPGRDVCIGIQGPDGVLTQALRAGRAYSEAVFNERIGGLGRLVEEIGRLIAAVRKFPADELRERVIADLRRTIDAAFKGAQ